MGLPELTDLRSITRDTDKVVTRVCLERSVYNDKRIDWLVFGSMNLRYFDRSHLQPYWQLGARMDKGVTDFEHDTAWALRFAIIGLHYHGCEYHHRWSGYVEMHDPEEFNVPLPGYDPANLPDATDCDEESCLEAEGHHRIVPENHYIPPHDRALWKMVRGRPIAITSGPTPDETATS